MTMLLAGVLLTGFSVRVEDHPVTGEMKELTGYRLRDKAINYYDFNLWVVTNEDVFIRDFEPLHDSVLRPQFEEQMVLAAKVQTINYAYEVRFKKTVVDNGTLNVYFTVRKQGDTELNEKPVSMAIVPKDRAIKKVNFFHDKVLVKTVPIVTVY